MGGRKGYSWQVRLMHYLHFISILVLVVSGFYIHSPWVLGFMGEMRFLHFLFMYILVFSFLVRIYWAIFGKEGDIERFLPEEKNRGKLLLIVKYYLFLEERKPKTAEYNPLQKITYISFFFLLFLQGLTGFSLYGSNLFPFSFFNQWIGGLVMMRTFHYLIMWIFIVIVSFHVYLSLAEDFRAFLNMFFALPYNEK